MDGLLVADKPQGLTSFDVVRRVRGTVRRVTGTRKPKVGHTGTLDPFATGVLPICVGRATRLARFLIEGDKVYRATLKLGETTDTDDIEGKVIESGDWMTVRRGACPRAARRARWRPHADSPRSTPRSASTAAAPTTPRGQGRRSTFPPVDHHSQAGGRGRQPAEIVFTVTALERDLHPGHLPRHRGDARRGGPLRGASSA